MKEKTNLTYDYLQENSPVALTIKATGETVISGCAEITVDVAGGYSPPAEIDYIGLWKPADWASYGDAKYLLIAEEGEYPSSVEDAFEGVLTINDLTRKSLKRG